MDLQHMEYQFEHFSQNWLGSAKKQMAQANARSKELAAQGWTVAKLQHGWSGMLEPTLFVVYERPVRRKPTNVRTMTQAINTQDQTDE